MNKTSIEWVRNPDGTQGYSWNPITGCLNGCGYCYARKLANVRLKSRYLANTNLPYHDEPNHEEHHADPFYPRWWESRWEEPLYHKRPIGMFTCDMGELFGPWLPYTWTHEVLDIVTDCPQHRFYLLTKQPQELVKWSPFPPNAWVGVSAWDFWSFENACHWLQDVQASVKYISLEPLLDWKMDNPTFFKVAGLSWLIIGAQTKPSVRVPQEWVENIIARAHAVGVSVFLKESLRYMVDKGGPHEPCFWPDPDDPNLWRLLQEFPDGKVIAGGKAVAK